VQMFGKHPLTPFGHLSSGQEHEGILLELMFSTSSSIVQLSVVMSSSQVWSTRFGFMSLGSLTVPRVLWVC